MYARRQRRVQSAITNSPNSSSSSNPDEILKRKNLKQVPALCLDSLKPRQGGGAATRLTADQLYSGSNPDLGSQ